MMEIVYFYDNFFCFTKNFFPLPLTLWGFFSKDFYPNPRRSFQVIFICTFTKKACKFTVQKDSKNVLSYQRNRTPPAKHLCQTPFFRFRLRASLVTESFLLKLKTITTCFELCFSQLPERQRLWTSLFLQMLQVAIKIRIHYMLFCGYIFTFKNFIELFLAESLFNINEDYNPQPRTLLSFITDNFMRVFRNRCTENFAKLSAKRIWWSSILIELDEYGLQPTTGLHYRYILERMFENFENLTKIFAELSFFL